jgi:hypothetical protein
VVGGPLEQAAQVTAVRVERPAAVAGKERDRSKLRLTEPGPGRPKASSLPTRWWSWLALLVTRGPANLLQSPGVRRRLELRVCRRKQPLGPRPRHPVAGEAS